MPEQRVASHHSVGFDFTIEDVIKVVAPKGALAMFVQKMASKFSKDNGQHGHSLFIFGDKLLSMLNDLLSDDKLEGSRDGIDQVTETAVWKLFSRVSQAKMGFRQRIGNKGDGPAQGARNDSGAKPAPSEAAPASSAKGHQVHEMCLPTVVSALIGMHGWLTIF